MLTYCLNSTIKYKAYKNLIIFLVVANHKQFMDLKGLPLLLVIILLKNFDYRYYLLIIYTSQQQFYLHHS